MEHGNAYKQLAEEIGAVLQSAAETAEKMLDDARAEAARIRDEAENDRRNAYGEGRRILDEARMEADMVRAEAEWQSQEIIAMARRQAAERIAGADARLAEMTLAESRVMDRLAGVGQLVSDAMASLRVGSADCAPAGPGPMEMDVPAVPSDDEPEQPTGKVYFVEFPPAAAAAYPEADVEIVIPEERSEWAPPSDLPAWWTKDGAQG